MKSLLISSLYVVGTAHELKLSDGPTGIKFKDKKVFVNGKLERWLPLDEKAELKIAKWTFDALEEITQKNGLPLDRVKTKPKLLNYEGQAFLRDLGFAVGFDTSESLWGKPSGMCFREYYFVKKPQTSGDEHDYNGCSAEDRKSDRYQVINFEQHQKELSYYNTIGLRTRSHPFSVSEKDRLEEVRQSYEIPPNIKENIIKIKEAVTKSMRKDGYFIYNRDVVANGGNIIYSEKHRVLFVGTNPNSSNPSAPDQIQKGLSLEAVEHGITVFEVAKTDPCHWSGYHLDTVFLEIDGHIFVNPEKISQESFQQLIARFGKDNITVLSNEECQEKATQAVVVTQPDGSRMLLPSGPVPESIINFCSTRNIAIAELTNDQKELLAKTSLDSGVRCRTLHHNRMSELETPTCPL